MITDAGRRLERYEKQIEAAVEGWRWEPVVQAVKWSRKAAEQNNLSAQYQLGMFYLEGKGVAKDHTEAYAWLHLAAKTSASVAMDRDDCAKLMTPQQIAAGQKRAEQLRAQIEARLKTPGKPQPTSP